MFFYSVYFQEVFILTERFLGDFPKMLLSVTHEKLEAGQNP